MSDVACRFVKYRGEWIAMQVNVPAAELEGREDPWGGDKDDVAIVPNALAAAAPELRDAVAEMADVIGRVSIRDSRDLDLQDALERARDAVHRAGGPR